MIFYLIFPGQSESDLSDHNIIGELQLNSFHVGVAWGLLNNFILQDRIDILNKIIIKDSSNKIWTIDKLLKFLDQYYIIRY